MPIIKFVNESEKIEYSTEQDVCSLLCYAFDASYQADKWLDKDRSFYGKPLWWSGL